jgi:hypothetical protein
VGVFTRYRPKWKPERWTKTADPSSVGPLTTPARARPLPLKRSSVPRPSLPPRGFSPSPRHGNRQPDHAAGAALACWRITRPAPPLLVGGPLTAAFRVEVVVVDSSLQKTPDELGAAIQRGACA